MCRGKAAAPERRRGYRWTQGSPAVHDERVMANRYTSAWSACHVQPRSRGGHIFPLALIRQPFDVAEVEKSITTSQRSKHRDSCNFVATDNYMSELLRWANKQKHGRRHSRDQVDVGNMYFQIFMSEGFSN